MREHGADYAPRYRGAFLEGYKSTDNFESKDVAMQTVSYKESFWIVASCYEHQNFEKIKPKNDEKKDKIRNIRDDISKLQKKLADKDEKIRDMNDKNKELKDENKKLKEDTKFSEIVFSYFRFP